MRFRLRGTAISAALAGVVLFSILGNLLSLTGTIYMMQIYDRVIASHSLPTLAVLSTIAVGFYIAQGLLSATTQKLTERIGLRLLARHEPTLMREVGRRAAEGQRGSGVAQPLEDLQKIARAIRGGSFTALIELPWSGVFLFGLALVAPWMAVHAFICVILLIAFVVTRGWLKGDAAPPTDDDAMARQAWEAAGRQRSGNAAAAMATLAGQVAGVRRDAREEERYARERDRDGRAFVSVLRNVAQSGILAVGAWLVITQQATFGVMMASSILMGRILSPVEALLRERKALGDAVGAMRRLKGLRLPDQTDDGPTIAQLAKAQLRADGLALAPTTNGAKICQGIKFAIEPGQAMVVMGASGTGKSLLLRVLAGLHPPASGAVRFDDDRLHDLDPDMRDRLIGFLPQELILLPGTFADAIARYDAGVPRPEVIAAAKRVELHEPIMALSAAYDTELPPKGVPLPYGFARRLSLARAICRKPHVLLLDDPLVGFDSTTLKIITTLVAEHKVAGGIVIIAGYHPVFQELADHILVLADGKMSAFGPPSEIFKAKPVAAAAGGKK